MKVSLIQFTGKGAADESRTAANLLAFTKATRLNMTPGLMAEIEAWSEECIAQELAYMAGTIPSSWEFIDYVFLLEGVSRAFTHQLVRTRAGSYAQQTLRVLDVSAGFDYVLTERNHASDMAVSMINDLLVDIERTYKALVALGQPPEDARGILPTNIATNIVCKFNLRTMAELAKSRTGGRTQGEYQAVVNAMCDEVLHVHPWAEKFLFSKGRDVFADIEAFAKAQWPDNLLTRGQLLKMVDRLRKELT